MTIAEKMLELLDEGWGTRTLRLRRQQEVIYRCAVGIRLDAAGMTEVCNEAWASNVLRDDPIIAAMARIIREQYPEAVRDYCAIDPPLGATTSALLTDDVTLVMVFNDRYAQESDIRAVIEKAVAEGL